MRCLYKVVSGVLLSIVLLACSSSSSDEEIVSVRFLADDIEIGESVRVEIEFTVDRDTFGDIEAAQIITEISAALQYEAGTAKISDGPSDTDNIDDADLEACVDGRTFARFSLSRDDLRGQEIGRGRYRLQFNVIGAASTSVATIEASAGYDSFGGCSSDFRGQREDGVEVLAPQ